MAEWEYQFKMFPVDADLPKRTEEMGKEGWMQVPGLMPQMIFPCYRIKPGTEEAKSAPKPTAGMGGEMKMVFDESKIFVIGPDGGVKQ
jgi:hypothetical protein